MNFSVPQSHLQNQYGLVFPFFRTTLFMGPITVNFPNLRSVRSSIGILSRHALTSRDMQKRADVKNTLSSFEPLSALLGYVFSIYEYSEV